MPIAPPNKPFPNYKWRWASFAPTEGLNSPPVYHGILRVLGRHEGERPNSEIVANALLAVEEELRNTIQSDVILARDPERNLLRNSKQYWTSLGLLESQTEITLTPFGRRVAEGHITTAEFAATIIKTLELPNRNLETDIADWIGAELQIRPLQLILEILEKLRELYGLAQSYLTPRELAEIVIPLAGSKSPIEVYAEALWGYRNGLLDIATWDDYTPGANDRRMAREFLLFLSNYGYCRIEDGVTNADDKYFLDDAVQSTIRDFSALVVPDEDINETISLIRSSGVLSNSERKRVLIEVLVRTQQTRFRKEVLRASGYSCLLTGEKIKDVLEAAHIVPVKYRGTDHFNNGFCLRADLHNLFDSKHLRIAPDATVVLSEVAMGSRHYRNLPARIDIPEYVDREAILWRWKYY